MGILDRLVARLSGRPNYPQQQIKLHPPSTVPGGSASSGHLTDDQAVERYRYLLRTAPPETIEQAHAEAFAQLTSEQRRLVLEGLSTDLPPQERTDRDDPQSLARMATRAELRRPGTLERTFGGMSAGGMGIGLGGLVAGSFLSSIAGVVIGTAVADAIFDDSGSDQGNDQNGADGSEAAEAEQGTDAADAGYDPGDAAYDAGGDVGEDFGGEFGGDFGGGEL